MSDIQTEFLARFSNPKVVRLTNPDKTRPTTVDTSLLALAVADADAAFTDLVEVSYDGDNSRHVSVAVRMVEVILMRYSVSHGRAGDKAWELITTDARKLRGTTSRKHSKPISGIASDTTPPVIGDDFMA